MLPRRSLALNLYNFDRPVWLWVVRIQVRGPNAVVVHPRDLDSCDRIRAAAYALYALYALYAYLPQNVADLADSGWGGESRA